LAFFFTRRSRVTLRCVDRTVEPAVATVAVIFFVAVGVPVLGGDALGAGVDFGVVGAAAGEGVVVVGFGVVVVGVVPVVGVGAVGVVLVVVGVVLVVVGVATTAVGVVERLVAADIPWGHWTSRSGIASDSNPL
jgi:hypothetical protein